MLAAAIPKQQIADQLRGLVLHREATSDEENANRINVIRGLLFNLLKNDQAEDFEEVICQSFAAGVNAFDQSIDYKNLLNEAYKAGAINCIKILYHAGHKKLDNYYHIDGLLSEWAKAAKNDPRAKNYSALNALLLYFGQDLTAYEGTLINDMLGFKSFQTKTVFGNYKTAAYTTVEPRCLLTATEAKEIQAEDQKKALIAQRILNIFEHLLVYGKILEHSIFHNPTELMLRVAYVFDEPTNSLGGKISWRRGIKASVDDIIDYSEEKNSNFFCPKTYLEAHLPADEKPRLQRLLADIPAFLKYDKTVMSRFAQHRHLAIQEVEFAKTGCAQIRDNPSYKYAGKTEAQQKAAFELSVRKMKTILAVAAKAHEINHRVDFANMSEDAIAQAIRDLQVNLMVDEQATTARVFEVLNQPRKIADEKEDTSGSSLARVEPVVATSSAKLSAQVKPITTTARALVKYFPIKADRSKPLFNLPVCRISSLTGSTPIPESESDVNQKL